MKQAIEGFRLYLLTHKRSAPNTVQAYGRDIAQCVNFLESRGLCSYEELTKELVINYFEDLRNKGISARSVGRKISALRLFFEYLHDYQQIPLTPFDLIFPKVLQKLPLYCTVDEIAVLLQKADEAQSPKDIRNKTILYMLYATGLRVSELANLRVSDIHFDTRRLDICGKGGKMRSVPLVPSVSVLLEQYLMQTRPQLIGKKVSDFVFPVYKGGALHPITRQTIWRIIKRFVQKTAMIKSISPHTLRHSLATHSLQQGWDLRSLQMLLGHENIATVQVYTHIELSHLKSSYRKKHPRS